MRKCVLLLVPLVLAAAGLAAAPEAPDAPDRTRLDGTWRLVSYKSAAAKEPRLVPEELQQIKLVTGGRFLSALVKDKKIVHAQGGRCAVEGEWYYEKLAFVFAKQDDWMVGAPGAFKWKLDGDRRYHEGIIRGDKAETHITEVWERVKKDEALLDQIDPEVGYLGVGLKPGDKGVLIREVLSGEAGAKAGIQVEDVVLAVNAKPTPTPQELIDQLKVCKVGTVVTLTIQRGGVDREVKATLGKRPVPYGAWQMVSFKPADVPEQQSVRETRATFKLVVGGRFLWATVRDGKVIRAAGGKSSITPFQYSERIDCVADEADEWMLFGVGHFTWKIEAGKWHHVGSLRGVPGESKIDEIWESAK